MSSKLYIRGLFTNGLGIGLLWLVDHFLGLGSYVKLSLGIQYVVYLLHALPQQSEKFYDITGSLTHLSVVFFASIGLLGRYHTARQLFASFASIMWATRLGSFLYARILKDGKDERFDAIKSVWLSFLGAWTLQGTWVVLIQLPVVLLNSINDSRPQIGSLDYLAMICWIVGFLFEAAADTEKMAFRSVPENKGKYLTTGLWALSRHPNYFGEILMWASMALLSSSAAMTNGNTNLHAGWISPLFTMFLLLCVSGVPMLESAGEKKWGSDPAYRHYMDNTSCVIPWIPASKKRSGAKKA